MENRHFTALDRILGEIDKAIKVLAAPARASRELPDIGRHAGLTPEQARESARLMRVNHSGEVAAQALYQGQAFAARTAEVSSAMQHAAAEEADHLAWCQQRLAELNSRPSVLNPLWYTGSFALGIVAGLLGDRASLGFVAETERQVESHLRGHMQRLSRADERSRAILEQMTHDEMRHGADAAALGATDLPRPVASAMRLISRLMTHGSYWM
jgi:ubiquinone biosynthesis monooxygenase Coq7